MVNGNGPALCSVAGVENVAGVEDADAIDDKLSNATKPSAMVIAARPDPQDRKSISPPSG